MSDKGKPIPAVKDALSLDADPESIKAYYAGWAESYDQDLEGHYTAPRMMVGLLCEYLDQQPPGLPAERGDMLIMDAGCGTGLVGELLHKSGFRRIDGTDISSEMVDKARELGVYRNLLGDIDINEPPRPEWTGAYHAVLCCGVFTLGHVPPVALHRLVDMARSGGVVITSTRTAYYDSSDYQQVSDALVASGRAELVKTLREAPYTQDSNAHYWMYQVRTAPASGGAGPVHSR